MIRGSPLICFNSFSACNLYFAKFVHGLSFASVPLGFFYEKLGKMKNIKKAIIQQTFPSE